MKHLSKALIVFFIGACLLMQPLAGLSIALAPSSFFTEAREYEPSIIRCPYSDDAAIQAAEEVIGQILRDQAIGKKTVLVLFTGGTATVFYREFVELVKRRGIDLSTVITFNLDEYLLPAKDKHSYRYFMQKELFDHVNIKPENIHFLSAYDIHGELLPESAQEQRMREYEDAMDSLGGPDIVMLGIGENGHIAFNEPDRAETDPAVMTHRVLLTEKTRQDNARFFGGKIENVPSVALTMGIGSILKAKKILLLAFGKNKKDAIEKMRFGPVNSSLPASFLRRHSDVSVYVDAPAMPLPLSLPRRLSHASYKAMMYSTFFVFQVVNAAWLAAAGLMCLAAVSLGVPYLLDQLGPAGPLPVAVLIGVLAWYNRYLIGENPYHNVVPGGKPRIEKEIQYQVMRMSDGNTIHYAQPRDPSDATRPAVFYYHGGGIFEVFIGAWFKFKDLFHLFKRYSFDIRDAWGNIKNPENSILRRIAVGMFKRFGKSNRDLPTVASFGFMDLTQWPLFNRFKFKTLATEPLEEIDALVQQRKFNSSGERIDVGSSTGARLRLWHTIRSFIGTDEETGEDMLKKDDVPKIRLQIMVNMFVHTSRFGNAWMRWQNLWLWRYVTNYFSHETSAYDEMDRSSDQSKTFDRMSLAANHKDWPQSVFIATRLTDKRLEPPKSFAVADVLKRLRFARDQEGGMSFYNWLGSFFTDFRGTDSVVDFNLALGRDYYGKPRDPRSIAIAIDGFGHECMGKEMVQKLIGQMVDLESDRLDLRQAYLEVTSPGQPPRVIELSEHKPEHEIVLQATDNVELRVRTPTEKLDIIDEKFLVDDAQLENPEFSRIQGWPAQPLKALMALEIFKSELTRQAWPLATEVEKRGPILGLSRRDEQNARQNARDLLAMDWISFTMLLEIWLAKGLVGIIPFPENTDSAWWEKFVAHASDIAMSRSKTRWTSNALDGKQFLRLHLADKKLQAQARNILEFLDPDYLQQFNEVMLALVNKGDWRELAMACDAWIKSRKEDFEQWMRESPQAPRLVYDLLGIKGKKALEILWQQYLQGRKSAGDVFDYFSEHSESRLLIMILSLDLKTPVGATAHALAPRELAVGTPVDMAA